VVIPVFNEPVWIRTCVEAVLAAGSAAGLALDVVVVDDGSTDGTPAVLAELAAASGIRVLTQTNAGRLAARSTGLANSHAPWVLLLDSRVIVAPGALRQVRQHIADHPDRRVWNGHINVHTRGNLFAALWSGITRLGWRRYFARPRLISFGVDEFDAYPKGTTAFLAPRDLLIGAVGEFRSLFDVAELSSDDTRLLRDIAVRERIWLDPAFCFTYHGKAGGKKFRQQAYFRGTTFVDSYLGQAGAVRRALLAAIAGAVLLLALLIFAPLVGLVVLVAALLALPAAVAVLGRGTLAEVWASVVLTPIFVVVFGLGVLRGLALAAVRRLRFATGRQVSGSVGQPPRS
jgi:glycosyltransferase involved in cell wall biosynthesis